MILGCRFQVARCESCLQTLQVKSQFHRRKRVSFAGCVYIRDARLCDCVVATSVFVPTRVSMLGAGSGDKRKNP